LDRQGFRDVEIVEVEGEGERAARSDPDAAIVPVAVDTARAMYGKEPLVLPNMAGRGAPRLALRPVGGAAGGRGGGGAPPRNHAPNENIVISDYVEGMKHVAWVLHRFART